MHLDFSVVITRYILVQGDLVSLRNSRYLKNESFLQHRYIIYYDKQQSVKQLIMDTLIKMIIIFGWEVLSLYELKCVRLLYIKQNQLQNAVFYIDISSN